MSDRQSNLDSIVEDTEEAVRESGEILRDGSAHLEHSEFGRLPREEIAERRAYREKIDRQSDIENYAMQNKDKYSDVRDALKITAHKRYDEHMMSDLEQRARANGTTVSAALRKYVNLEEQLRRDPQAGLLTLSRSLGLDPGAISAALQPYQQAHPGQTQADMHASAQYHEAVGIEQEAARAVGPQYKELQPYLVDILNHPNFQQHRSPDMRQTLSNAIHFARIAHRQNRQNAQTQKQKRATRSVSGSRDPDYSEERPQSGDRLDGLRADIRRAARSL